MFCKEYNLEHLYIYQHWVLIRQWTQIMLKVIRGRERNFKKFSLSTILRPSLVYSSSDSFSTSMMTLLNRLPVFAYYSENFIYAYSCKGFSRYNL